MAAPIVARRTIQLRRSHGVAGSHVYRVAGVQVESDFAIRLLEPFSIGSSGFEGATGSSRDCDGLSVAVAQRRIDCHVLPDGHRLEIEGLGAFSVAPTPGGAVVIHEPEAAGGELTALAVEEALVGPVLALALAECGVFALHASAVELEGRVLAIAGPSGAGKSTLAAAIDRMGPPGRRIADDILPVTRSGQSALSIVALPRFPQLKLAAADAYPATSVEALPLTSVVVLESEGETPGECLTDPLPPAGAVAELLRHGVAGRLFGPRLTAARLDCVSAAVAGSLPVRRLRYCRTPDELPDRAAALVDLLAAAALGAPAQAVAG